MADNTDLNAGAGGDKIVTREVSHGGDTAKLQGVFLMGTSGTEGSYTVSPIDGDATNGIDVDVTRSVLPTGAATSANQSTIIGHVDGIEALLGTIDADTSALAGAVAGTEVQVDIVSSALPSGASTSANQATVIGHLDGVEGLLTTIDADTSALAGTVSGTEVQVDIVAALPAGTNNIGDVDVLSIVPGTGATNLGKAVDSAAGATDTGIADLAIRDDVLATLTPVDGDYTNLRTNARGALWVALDSTAAQTVTIAAGTANIGDVDILSIAAGDNNIGNVDIVTMPNVTLAAGTNTNEIVGDVAQDVAVAGNPVLVGLRASTATPTAMSADGDSVYAWADRNGAQVVVGNVLDDAAFTAGTNRVVPIGLFADETATDSVDEGDIGAARMTLDRKTIVTPYIHAAAGGATPYKNIDVDESEDAVKASAGKLYWLHAMNLTASVVYLKFYNATVASVTVGTTVPDLTFPIPTMGDTNGAGFAINFGDAGLQFSTAITVAATTGLADNNSGAPAANAVVVNLGYS